MRGLARLRNELAGLTAALLLMPLFWPLLERTPDHAWTATFGGRTWALGEPRWMLLLLALPYAVFAAFASLTSFSAAARGGLTAARGLLILTLALALARPYEQRPTSATSIVALVDVSASVSDTALAKSRALVSRLAAADPTAKIVAFAGEPSEVSAGQISRLPDRGGDETDLALALGLGLGLLEPERVPRLLLFSDGRATKGDAPAEAERARARGARVFFHMPAGHAGKEESDVAMLALEAPDSVRPGAGFDLTLKVAASRAGPARIALFRDGAPEPERDVDLSAGITEVRWSTRVESGTPVLYRASLRAAAGNGRKENDEAVLAVVPEPRPQVLVVEHTGRASEPFRRALAAEQIDTTVLPPTRFPDRAALAGYDLVVLADLPRGALRDAHVGALEAYVRDGGGLLVAGGPDSFGSGGYQGTRLEDLIPIRHDASDERQEATLALALVIDRSGSMSGPKMELTKEAARGTAEMLGAQDLITVVVFDSQAQTVVRLQPASNRQRILSDIAQIRASGGTNILPGMREAFEQLLAARARKKHVIVLSDGQSPVEGIQELVDEAAAARITVSAVGVGEGADLAVLQMIASRGGGRFYHTRDPSSIPKIFTREAAQFSRSSVVEEPTTAIVRKPTRALAGVPFESAPPLRGYARTRARREAELLLVTRQGDPLLARWQLGLGQSMAWTSDLAARWSADWARWSAYAKLWGQLARSAMRRQGGARVPVRSELLGDRVRAWVEVHGADERPLGGLTGELRVRDVVTSLSGERRVPLSERSPGRYEAELPVGAARALVFDAELRAPGVDGAVAQGTGRLGIPPAREQMPPMPETLASGGGAGLVGRPLLAAVASRTGGRELEADQVVEVLRAVPNGEERVMARVSLRLPVLLVTLLVFLAEVTFRRVRFRGPGRR